MGTFEKGYLGGFSGKSARPSALPGKASTCCAAGHPEKERVNLLIYNCKARQNLD